MRVMMLAMDYPPNIFAGIGIHAYELASALTKLGIEVDVFVIPHANTISSENYSFETINGHTVYRFVIDEEETKKYSMRNLPTRKELRNIIWNVSTSNVIKPILDIALVKKYDVIHMHDYFNVIVAEAIRNALNIPIVNTVHDTGIGGHKLHYHLRHYSCLISDINIAVSKYQAEELLKESDIEKRKIRVINNGVRKSAIHYKKKEFNILFVGRLTHTKGCMTLLEAYNELIKSEELPKNSSLIFVGDGPIIDEIKEYVHKEDLSNCVRILGHQNNKVARQYMREAMVLVAPSKRETFGLVALEAMAESACVVASEGTGFADFIINEMNGLLIKPDSINAICCAIKRIFQDESLRERLIANGLETASKMNWDDIAIRTVDVYKETIKEYENNDL